MTTRPTCWPRSSAARSPLPPTGSSARSAASPAPLDGFPIDDYDELTAAQIVSQLGGLEAGDLRRVRDYERRNANRKTVLSAVDTKLS